MKITRCICDRCSKEITEEIILPCFNVADNAENLDFVTDYVDLSDVQLCKDCAYEVIAFLENEIPVQENKVEQKKETKKSVKEVKKRAPRNAVSDETIINTYKKLKNIASVAKELHIGKESVSDAIYDYEQRTGEQIRQSKGRPKKEVPASVYELLAEGKTIKEVIELTGQSQTSVYKVQQQMKKDKLYEQKLNSSIDEVDPYGYTE